MSHCSTGGNVQTATTPVCGQVCRSNIIGLNARIRKSVTRPNISYYNDKQN